MKVQGEYSLPLPQPAAWDLLLNTEVLSRAIPGCESLAPAAPDEYEMKMKIAVSSIQGLFAGKVRISEKTPPASYRLEIQGQGKLGHVRGNGVLQLAPDGNGTKVSFAGDVQVGGLLASVGERMLDMTTKMMIKKFFNALVAQAQKLADSRPAGA
ncbi:MAG TPA: carbon monoxide dehydrogenase subunit G [Bryobacterales bacterium]|jgi:carbon monoxide dehydrogenase subunit G|nr:carbon monoxide dehydrogenase subunit G [Bryobacterales bacterium]